jgi:hypothetical protein
MTGSNHGGFQTGLPKDFNLVEGVREGRIGARGWSLAVILDLAENRKGLLRIRQISTVEGIGQLFE